MSKYVFISYSSKNQSVADATRELFKKENIPCWMAPYDIPAGEKYAHVINDALENCSCLLLLLSNDSQNSQFVEIEVERAKTYQKPIITMQIEDVALNSGFKFYLGSEQIVPVYEIDNNSENMKKIIDSVLNYVDTSKDEEETAENKTAYETSVKPPRSETSTAVKSAAEMQAEFSKANVGDTIMFGAYEQDSEKWEHKEPLEWIVLAREKDKMLVITKYCIEGSNVFRNYKYQRRVAMLWLNETFVNYAFNQEEKKIIKTIKNNPFKQISWKSSGLAYDMLFFLSRDDVRKYFLTEETCIAKPTVYASERGIRNGHADESCDWYVNSEKDAIKMDSYINDWGRFESKEGNGAYYLYAGIRPAMWIDLKAKK